MAKALWKRSPRANDPSADYVTLQAAKGINERGQIIAWGFDSRLGGGARAYLLTPAEYP
jgi:hypothetical protein